MKKIVISFVAIIMLMTVGNTGVNATKEGELIDITTCKIVNENYIDCMERDANILFNEQGKLPKTATKLKEELELTTWQPNYNINFGKPSFYVDLGAYYVITNISYYDTYGVQEGKVYQGDPSNWEEIGILQLNGYKAYKIINNNKQKPVRYIRVNSDQIQSGIAELGIYGYKVSELTKEDIQKTGAKASTTSKDNLTSGKKIGANAFCDDPYTALAALGNIREYYSWNWFVTDNQKFAFNNVVNHDNYFKTLKEMEIDVIPCVQYTDETLRDKKEDFDKVRNYKPIEAGADASNPLSYQLHSNFMYNFAARYGNNKNIDTSTLAVENGTETLVGLGYLDTIEPWNEQNKTWEGVDGYFTPEEYAAMLSSDWDGHEGAIPNGGVKKADSNFKIAMGGLWWQGSDTNVINYLERMKTWFDYHRKDGAFCADIINVHIGVGKNPEQGDWESKIEILQKWIDENVPGTELWISEFDVDVSELEVEGIDNHDNLDYQEARAQRLLRAFLVGDRYEVDRLSMFMLRDTSYGTYYNSGLTTQKGEWDKKQSWYYISCATDTLKNADLVQIYETDQAYVYQYKDRETSEVIYAVWSPTTNGTELKNCTLQVGNYEKATIVTPTDGIMEGEKESRNISDGKITIDISETVQFIKVSNNDVPYDNYPQKLIPIQELRLGELNGTPETFTFSNSEVVSLQKGEQPSESNFMLTQFYHLFDEQNEKNTPQTPWRIIKKENKPTTEMGALSVHKDRAYPYDAIITFDDYYDITYIGLYDTYSVGNMEIYDDITGKLIYATKLDTYDYWRLEPMTQNITSTNRIRIVKYDDAKINELSFYGYKTNSKVGKEQTAVKGEIGEPEKPSNTKLAIDTVELGEKSLAFKGQNANILKSMNFLFDEQEKTPSYAQEGVKQGTSWKTAFTNIWGNGLQFPYDGIVKLKKQETVSKVGLWLGWGENQGKIEIYDNTTNELIFSKTVEGRNKWLILDLEKEVKTDSLKIVKYDTKPIYEISFYGK